MHACSLQIARGTLNGAFERKARQAAAASLHQAGEVIHGAYGALGSIGISFG